MWWITYILSVMAGGLAIFYWYRKCRQRIFVQLGIKGPPPNFLFGNLHQPFMEDRTLYETYQAWGREYGKVFGYYEGSTPVLVTSDLGILKEAFIKQFSNFHGRKVFPLQPDPDHGKDVHMLLTRGERWKRLRSITTPTFSATKMRQMSPLMNKCIDVYLDKLETKRQNDEAFDIYDMTQSLTIDVMAECAFGIQVDSQSNPNDQFLTRCRTLFMEAVQGNFLIVLGLLLPELSRFWWWCHGVLGYIKEDGFVWLAEQLERVINMRRKNTEYRRGDLLQTMIDAEKYPIRERRASHLIMTTDSSSSERGRSSSGEFSDKYNRKSSSDFNSNRYNVPNGYSNGHVSNGDLNGHVTNGQTNHSATTNGHVNGHVNGVTNGHVHPNTNGHTNGSTNGYANGHVKNGSTNGHTKGQNGHTNGHTNGHVNGNVNHDLNDEVFDDRRSHKQGLTVDEIKAQCVLFLLAGYETTSVAITYTAYELACHPEVQIKLQAEIDQHYDNNTVPSYENVNRLQYLDMVLCEVLRLYPAASTFVARRCMNPCTVGGMDIPVGMCIQANVWTIHRDPEIWGPNTDQLDPERFSPENKANRNPLAWMPFGIGPRNCVGMRFSWLGLKIAIVRLMMKYTIVSCDETQVPLQLKEGSTITPKDNVMVKLRLREQEVDTTD